VLRNHGIEDFVKSFREGSKATIVRRGENRSGRFTPWVAGEGRFCFPKTVMGGVGFVFLGS